MNEEVKRAILLIVGVIIAVVCIKCIQGKDSTLKDLKKRGYSEEEINILLENLTEEEIKNVTYKEYNELLPKLISHKYYIKDNHQKYLDYKQKNNNLSLDEVISIINVRADKDWYKFTTLVEDFPNSILVNRYYFLPHEYEPEGLVEVKNWYAYDGNKLVKEAYEKFIEMHNAAASKGLRLIINTSYRTSVQQENIYNVSGDLASKPGHSEHQTGLAIDIMTDRTSDKFENTEEFKWLINNSYKYGYILRYPKDKEKITGYAYEPWHYRYLGVELATKVHNSGLTYDEYFAYYCEYKKEC